MNIVQLITLTNKRFKILNLAEFTVDSKSKNIEFYY